MKIEKSQNPDKPLPSFRRDLQLFQGPYESDGSPTFNLYDPVKEQYYKLGWAEATIIQQAEPGLTMDQLLRKIQQNTTVNITSETLTHFYNESLKLGLLHIPRPSDQLLKEYEASRRGIIANVLLYYLFFRIPLFNPDRFLQNTLKYVRPFLSKVALTAYAGIALWGFVLVISRWDEFLHTFTYFFNPAGFVAYALGIFFAKMLHEFAHAYTAKRYGVHVPTMGVAFLVLMPVLFTDATDAWKLASRSKRMAITLAGIVAELALAGLATVLWAFSEPGIMQSTWFVLATITWIGSLLINANPAVRFDGYYALSDWLGVENLQDRSFSLLRRQFYRIFFGLNLTETELTLPVSTRRIMAVYAIFTFLYRIILYTAIALFVYHEFTKVLGIFLFAMEVIIFFIWPVAYETKVYLGLRQYITWNRRFILSITSAALLTAWFVLPFPHTYRFAAITVPYNLQAIYVPESGRIDEVYVTRGQKVEANSPIVRIDSFPLYNKFERAQVEEAIASKKTEIIAQDDALRAQYSQKRAEEIQVERTLQALENRQRLFNIQAVHAGYIVEWNELMLPGVYVKTGAMLGLIADNNDVDVICFVPERDKEWLREGKEVAFRPRHSSVTVNGKVIQTNSNRATTLLYPGLGSVHHGPLPVVQSDKQYILQESFYEARVKLDAKDTLRFGETGYIEVKGPWSSLLMRTGRYVLSVLFQESSL